MTEEKSALQRRRDQALRDLLELERQVGNGELSSGVAIGLRRNYEHEAANALAALDRLGTQEENHPGTKDSTSPASPPWRIQPRQLLYGLGLLTLLSAILVLPSNVLDRPEGGFVTGNEAVQGPNGPSGSTPKASQTPARDLDKVTDQELEAVVAANPDVLGMRLALADRYTEKGRYDLAVVHYSQILEQDPVNAKAKAHLGWLMLQLEEPVKAARLVEEALALNPKLLDALWFKANIRLYGFDDAKGTLKVLDTISKRSDIHPQVRRQVKELRADASQRLANDDLAREPGEKTE